MACSESPLYFIDNYCHIYDATVGDWIPFKLWKSQARTLRTIFNNLLVIILKARQLGMTWLVLAFALWLMLFRPAATVLLFSKRDDEAMYLLGDERFKGMYKLLPRWLQARRIVEDNGHDFVLSNGSAIHAFPTTAGDSYTATLAIVDEADLVPDLGKLMRSVKPTIDAGGRMILLSRVDKSKPQSAFKNLYRAAKQRLNEWATVFLPWFARPDRNDEWHAEQEQEIMSRTGSLDDLYEQYPATDAEALAPRTLDKRIAPKHLQLVYDERGDISVDFMPTILGLTVYVAPEPDETYIIGADPAEGNPTSDPSAACVLNANTGEECATLAGQFEPSVFASYIDELGQWFNNAEVMPERNNHGHAVILWLNDNSELSILVGHDGKPGWLSSSKGKALLYASCADACRDEEVIIHSFATYTQLASIEGATLRAPKDEHDDRADAFALACVAMSQALTGQLVI